MTKRNNSVFKLTNDVIFKAVYGRDDDKSREALIKVLNLILDRKKEPIVSVEILNPINYAKYVTDKESILDIRCRTSSDEVINVEMQVEPLRGTANRVVYYHASSLSKILKTGEDYAKMNKVISICIMAKNYLQDTEGFHSIFKYKNVKTGAELVDISEIHFVELGKIDCSKSIADMTELEQFGAYLLNVNTEGQDEYVEELKAFGNEVIQMSDYVLRKCTEEEILRELAEDRELFKIEREAERIRKEMVENKLAKAEKAQRDTISNLKKEGIAFDVIARCTGLTIEEIEQM